MTPLPASPATLFCLPFLGGSAREWGAVAAALPAHIHCHPLDLPGFGDAAGQTGYGVAEMADHVAARIRDAAPAGRWLLAGHSMGAKVAAVLARRAVDGDPALRELAGVVTLAGSPPSPEPMAEERRQEMLGWFNGSAEQSATQAARFVDANAARLSPEARTLAERDVLRANPAAWRAWLAAGSREDWSGRIGTLPLPALILAGAEDADLGPDAQQRLMVPHYAKPTLRALPGVQHLLPLEAPEAVAEAIAGFAAAIASPAVPVPPDYLALLRSPRTAGALRDGLLARTLPDDPAPQALSPEAMDVLRAVLDRVVPQPGPARIDLAARIDAVLAAQGGDGWRFAALPPDAEAAALALRHLGALGFTAMDAVAQDALLRRCADGELPPGPLDGAQMALWFGDLRAMAVKQYIGHPATLARMGYSGVASGGDGPRKSGFREFGMDVREAWEPRS
ncbi:alpha/beta hydrolase [Roseomonas haemaphysalidis]|uniref:Alpha/beta fold hydrolase n=1 Tax=Roseomonas haemaphysalidis TaxID=2768162 RepID=A0ABS3KL48_9PROT|nr:alpha/beta fold hydrolase [Roseomonas haemaphysalidis]MBO1077675.1 alpha/beta fold hydrolase [Roseomonas haemaphysalidis]